MFVAFDCTFLSIAFCPETRPTEVPSTGKPIENCKERVEGLIDDLSEKKAEIIIPSPCLCEMLCKVPDIERALTIIYDREVFRVRSFDSRCAYELAKVTRKAIDQGDKKSGSAASWNKVKFDRQIVVIAKVCGAEVLYTDDQNQAKFSKELELPIKHTWDLALPKKYKNLRFPFDDS